jgi:hypothetical protein
MAQQGYTASATGVVAGPWDAGAGKTRGNFNMKVSSAAPNCVVALETSPDNTTYTEVCRVTGPNWCFAASSDRARYAHVNVINLGTGAPPVAAVICGQP